MTVPFLVLSIVAISIIVITLLLALKWQILAKIGVRNALRRKITMLLIIAGSMIGTAFIVGSFVINDSFQYFMYSGIRQNLGTIDEIITPNKSIYFSQGDFSKILSSLSESKYVESVLPIMTKSTVAAPVGQIRSLDPAKIAQINFIGVDLEQLKTFGSGRLFPNVNLSGNEVVISSAFANPLKLKVGDSFEAIINPFQLVLGAPQKFKIAAIVPEEGVLGYKGIQGITSPIFMTIAQMKNVFSIDNYNEILVANKGNYISGAQYTSNIDQTIKNSGASVKIYNVKKDQIENLNQGQIGWLFLILSGFSIAAGILLLINVYTMLSDERMSELGTLRAIGFSRRKVGFILYFEGFVYSVIASFLGVFVGLGIAWFMITEFSNLATNVSNEFTPLMNTGTFSFSLHFSTFSLIYGFLVGLIVPTVVLLYMAFRTGRFNIVMAIRQIPADQFSDNKHRNFIAILVLFSLAIVISIFAVMTSNAIVTYGAIMSAILLFPFFFKNKRFRRIIGNLFSLGVVIFAFASNLIPYIEAQSDKSLWLLGLRSFSILLASLFLLSYNFEIFDRFLGIFSNRKSRAAVKLAVAETAQHKRRTGLTIAMYSIVIFVISLMTVIPYSETLQINSAKNTIFGGYDTVGIPIIGKLNVTSSQLSNLDFITYYATMSMISVKYNSIGKVSNDYQMVLLNNRFVQKLDLSVENGINGIRNIKDLFDYMHVHPGTVAILGLKGLKIGQNVEIANEGSSDFNFSQSSQNVTSSSTILKNPKTFTVVGILKSSSNYSAIPSGFYTTSKTASVFGALSPTEFLLTKLSGNTDKAQYQSFQKLTAFLKTRFIFALFSKQTVDIFTNIINGFVSIINTFLYFGLSVGIIGLAILIIKSLHERRRMVGVLKALGFSRGMIFRSFFLEINFVVVLGILIGFISGIVTSYLIYATLNLGALSIPWDRFIELGLVFYLISIIMTFIPTRNATKITPVEALKYRE